MVILLDLSHTIYKILYFSDGTTMLIIFRITLSEVKRDY